MPALATNGAGLELSTTHGGNVPVSNPPFTIISLTHGVAVEVAVGVGVNVAVAVDVGVGEAVGVAVAVGVGGGVPHCCSKRNGAGVIHYPRRKRAGLQSAVDSG